MNFSTVTAAKFDFNTSILVLVFVVLGGLGNIWGSIVAAALLTLLPELLRGLSNYRMLIYAILLIVMMLFNNSSFKVRLLEKRAMRQMEKAEKAGGKKEGCVSHGNAGSYFARHFVLRSRAVARAEHENRKGRSGRPHRPNGAGKTTAFNMLTGVYRPTRRRHPSGRTEPHRQKAA